MNEKELIDYLNNIDFENSDIVYNEIEKLVKENQELKLELSGYRQAILNNEEMLGLKEQNEKLKKQVEEYQKELEKADSITQSCIFNGKEESKISYRKCLNILDKKETQQKEFIKYLEDESKEIYRDGGLRQNIFRQILQKYREIMGVSDEKK